VEVKGYKAFNKDHTNRYGIIFEEGKDYHVDGPISFGNNGNGFHMCTHLSDVFRFFVPDDISVAQVTGSGEYVVEDFHDWSESYLDMYAVSDIHIDKFLTREEIIDIMSKSSSFDIVKFFATFRCTPNEGLQVLKGNMDSPYYNRAVAAFLYYLKNINAYDMGKEEQIKTLKKVLDNGQDSNQRSKGK